MIHFIKKLTVAVLALFVAVGTFVPLANVFAASFNNDSRDYATLQVSNYTRNPGSNSNWSNAVSANAGEVISFLVYYHNTAADTANNTRIRVQLPSGSFTSATVNGDVWSSNASTVTGSGSINLSSNQTLTLIPGSVSLYANQSSVAQALPNGQNGSEIVSSNGLLIGDVASGWGTQGYVVFRAQVSSGTHSSTDTSSSAKRPYVTTKVSSSVTRNAVLLRGAVSANGSIATAWFDYGTTSSLGNKTTAQAVGQSWSSTSYSIALSGLQGGTTYYYRSGAQNARGITYGKVLSFTTSQAGVAQVASTATIGRTAIVHSGTVVADGNNLITLTPSIDIVRPNAGDTISYTIMYSNNTNAALRQSQLRVLLPKEISFIKSSVDPAEVSDNAISFDLGTIPAQSAQSIDLTLRVDSSVKADDALSINAVLDHTNANGTVQTTSAFLTFLVNNGVAGLASLSSVFGSFLGNWFLDLILGLLIGFGIYHFFMRQKEEVLIK